MFQTKAVGKFKTYVSCFLPLFVSKNRTVYETTWENTVEPNSPQMKIPRMGFTCCLLKAKDKHSEYVTFNAFSLHQ